MVRIDIDFWNFVSKTYLVLKGNHEAMICSTEKVFG